MAKYEDASWLTENVWGTWGKDDEVGVLNDLTPEMILKAVSLIKKGKIYDLETERFKGMPVWPGHCDFEMLAYATPSGRRNMLTSQFDPKFNWSKPGAMFDPATNAPNLALNTEMLIGPLHAGTHIDAFCHWTCGDDDHWYNGFTAGEHSTNFGPTRCDVAKIPPIVMRGVLLDIAGYKGLTTLEKNYIITAEDCEAAAKRQGTELRKGDAVLLRTGEVWPDNDKCSGAGVGITAARYLVEGCGAMLIGDDMAAIDGYNADGTSSWPHHPSPVHHYLLIQRAVHVVEFLQLDELAKDGVYDFCFICTAPKIRSATGMYVRPIALV